MSDAETYKLDELAEQSGVSARTVRYYVQRGLLPPPTFRGKDSSYGREHLVRLQAIKRLQEQYLPLDAIAEALAQRTVDQIEGLATGRDSVTPVTPQIPPASPHVEVPEATRWQRYVLAPGVELQVMEPAGDETRRLVERLKETAASNRPIGGGGSKP